MSTSAIPEVDAKWVSETLRRAAAEISMLLDRKFAVRDVAVDRAESRPAADGGVHISFKLALQRDEQITHGAVLVPYAEAVSLAAWSLMMDDDEARRRAQEPQLDHALKDGLLEISKLVAAAAESSCRNVGIKDARVVSEGCQGVKPGVRPAFTYEDGQTLTIGRADAQLANGTPFTMLALMPALTP